MIGPARPGRCVDTTVQIEPNIVVTVERIDDDRFVLKATGNTEKLVTIEKGSTLTVTIPIRYSEV